MDAKGKTILWLALLTLNKINGQTICPPPETILPCICTHRQEDFQIWCTHSDLTEVSKGISKVGESVDKRLDELIIENNYLPSLPGKVFQNLKVLRLMLRNNGLERVSSAWLEPQENNLVEIYIVENELKSIPPESLMKLQNLQALTIRSNNLKRIPPLSNMPKLIYVNILSGSLSSINEHTFENLPNLEKLFIQGSQNLYSLKENAFYNLPKLLKLEISDCSISSMHMRALSLLPMLNELSLSKNRISDATMVSRATRDLPMLSILNLNFNSIRKLNEGAFVDLSMLEKLFLSNNDISTIHHGAFHRVPKLRVVDLNYNKITSIHPEAFMQQSGSGIEELSLVGNRFIHISAFRSLLEALPRLKFLDLSDNLLQDIPRGALRGHANLEILHFNKNKIKFIQEGAFIAMPALRELHLSYNSLTDSNDGSFWNLPALKGLDLSNNSFKRVQPKMLYNLPSLRRINLSNNQLAIIDPLSFIESSMLEHVNISGNSLVSLHPATFRNLVNLYEIDVSSNRLVEFVPGLPRGLEKLYLSKNQITNLPTPPSPDLDLPSLRTLDISNNGIQKIPYGSTKTLHNLRRFYMRRNGLRQIEMATFNDMEHLEVIDLSDNQIIDVHPKSFSKLVNLKQVNLHGNSLENFDFGSIKNNIELSNIDISKNKLKHMNPGNIREALNVEVFNISSNSLDELPASLNTFSKLVTLDASNNHLKQFDGNIINNIHSLMLFKMHSNKIKELRAGSFQDLKKLESIDLENNQIEIIHTKTIANLVNLLSVYLGRNHIVDIPDRTFSDLPKLRIVELQGNRLQFISMRAFDNIPLLQYLNLSNNLLTNLENSGIRQLTSLEVLDISFNRLTRITRESFQYMEWLVELNLDNNGICYISGQPFDYMPRLKVLSLQRNKLVTINEKSFAKLRNNIAILDLDGNPLICNCEIIWLKSWLLESSSIGPKCEDGTFVKEVPFSRNECLNYPINEQNLKTCPFSEDNVPPSNIATSQVMSSLDKIRDYETQIKNNYGNRINNRPLPQESDYFYDEYVDYPYNETIIEGLNNEINQMKNENASSNQTGNTPTIYAAMNNTVNHKTGIALKVPVPNSGFTFFGLPLPSLDMGQILGTARKVDWSEQKNKQDSKFPESVPPKFETGGFSPMLPTSSSGFMPMPNPNMNTSNPIKAKDIHLSYGGSRKTNDSFSKLDFKQPINTVLNNTTHKKIKTEIHEFETYQGRNNNTQLAYNKTKNVQEQNSDPNNIRKYNMMESNITITQITEKENIITTDTSHDISLQEWLTTAAPPSSPMLPFISKTVIEKASETQPSLISTVFTSNNDNINKNLSRTATITKVNMPHAEHYDLRSNYAPVINREAKRFSDATLGGNTKSRPTENNDWYYENYNKSNIEPYIAPSIQKSNTDKNFQMPIILFVLQCSLMLGL